MRDLSWPARGYVGALIACGAALIVYSLPAWPATAEQWILLAALSISAAAAQLFPVVTAKNQAYYVTLVFIFAGVLLLPAGALALLVILAFIPEWIKIRYPWYIQLFNIANFLVNAFLARAIYLWAGGTLGGVVDSLGVLVGAVLAAAAFTFVNHLLLAVVLHLARGHSWRKSGLFDQENFLIDATLTCMGIIVALLWEISPWPTLLAAAPLFLIYRALNTPNLLAQARTDTKTGLYNSKYFTDALEAEIRRARRFQRPVSVVMADLDLLRNINNTYGHLAGDAVLKGVAEILKAGLREYDVAARFGGEEFALVLPETDAAAALDVAQRLRKQVEEARFVARTSIEPIRATLSLGVASFPVHGGEADEIIHQADLAVYYAKLKGRNLAVACSSESAALDARLEGRWNAETFLYPVGPSTPATASVPPSFGEGEPAAAAEENERSGREEDSDSSAGAGPGGHPEEAKITAASPLTATGVGSPEQGPGWRNRVLGDTRWTVFPLIGTVLLVAGALWLARAPGWQLQSSLDWLGLGTLALLTGVGQSMVIDIYGRGKVSVAGIVLLAGGILFGIDGVLLLAPIIPLVQWILHRGLLYRSAFDAGNLTLSGAAFTVVFAGLTARIPLGEPLVLFLAAVPAAVAYYAVNIALLCLAMGASEKRSPLEVWNERFRWLLAHYVVYGALAVLIALAYRAIGVTGLLALSVPPVMMRYVMKQYTDRTVQNVAALERVHEELVQSHAETLRTLEELQRSYDATMTALLAALDTRDSETEGHSQRVVEYAVAIARQLGLSALEMRGLINGARLHDVGKIGVPDAILRKPGPLTAAEWATMKQHPELGYRMLKHIGLFSDAIPVIRYHHERYDGKGYPAGLHGSDIPLCARIFAVADAYDAMTSNRPYRAAFPAEYACEELARSSGSQFDPQIVEAFLKVDITQLAPAEPASVEPEVPSALRKRLATA